MQTANPPLQQPKVPGKEPRFGAQILAAIADLELRCTALSNFLKTTPPAQRTGKHDLETMRLALMVLRTGLPAAQQVSAIKAAPAKPPSRYENKSWQSNGEAQPALYPGVLDKAVLDALEKASHPLNVAEIAEILLVQVQIVSSLFNLHQMRKRIKPMLRRLEKKGLVVESFRVEFHSVWSLSPSKMSSSPLRNFAPHVAQK